MTESQACPRCGRELPDDAPRGLCPACLLGAALASPGDTSDQTPGSDVDAPGEAGDTAADPRQAERRPGTIDGETVDLDSRGAGARRSRPRRGPPSATSATTRSRPSSAAAAWASSTAPARSASTGPSP